MACIYVAGQLIGDDDNTESLQSRGMLLLMVFSTYPKGLFKLHHSLCSRVAMVVLVVTMICKGCPSREAQETQALHISLVKLVIEVVVVCRRRFGMS